MFISLHFGVFFVVEWEIQIHLTATIRIVAPRPTSTKSSLATLLAQSGTVLAFDRRGNYGKLTGHYWGSAMVPKNEALQVKREHPYTLRAPLELLTTICLFYGEL